MTRYPILIFAYNRPHHLINLLKSLEKNKFITKHKIYVFCDGPKNKSDKNKIFLIKKIIKNSKLNFYQIVFNKKNLGLSKNIIKGVSKVLIYNKACIVFEDDLILHSKAVQFLNFFLNYRYSKYKVGSVSAYSYLDDFYKYKNNKYYLSKRHCSWGWGTWSKIWNKINWDQLDYEEHFKNKLSLKNFSEGGDDLNLLLWGQKKNLINSWAIRFNFFCKKKELLCIQPRYSLINNCGNDMSGTHSKFSYSAKKKKFKYNKFNLSKKIFNEKLLLKSSKVDYYIKTTNKKSLRLFFYQSIYKIINLIF